MKSHSKKELKTQSEQILGSKEFRDFVKSIPYDKVEKYYLLDNIIIYVEKRVTMSYIDIFGKSKNDILLNLIIEDKTNAVSISMENIEFNS